MRIVLEHSIAVRPPLLSSLLHQPPVPLPMTVFFMSVGYYGDCFQRGTAVRLDPSQTYSGNDENCRGQGKFPPYAAPTPISAASCYYPGGQHGPVFQLRGEVETQPPVPIDLYVVLPQGRSSPSFPPIECRFAFSVGWGDSSFNLYVSGGFPNFVFRTKEPPLCAASPLPLPQRTAPPFVSKAMPFRERSNNLSLRYRSRAFFFPSPCFFFECPVGPCRLSCGLRSH